MRKPELVSSRIVGTYFSCSVNQATQRHAQKCESLQQRSDISFTCSLSHFILSVALSRTNWRRVCVRHSILFTIWSMKLVKHYRWASNLLVCIGFVPDSNCYWIDFPLLHSGVTRSAFCGNLTNFQEGLLDLMLSKTDSLQLRQTTGSRWC